MLNKVMLIGRLVRDVELKSLSSGKTVANASIATSKKFKNSNTDQYEERTEYHNLVIWNGSENFAKYLSKGSKVYVEGELMTRSWEKDGVKRYATEVNVNNFTFLDSKSEQPKEQSEPKVNLYGQEPIEKEINVDDLF